LGNSPDAHPTGLYSRAEARSPILRV